MGINMISNTTNKTIITMDVITINIDPPQYEKCDATKENYMHPIETKP